MGVATVTRSAGCSLSGSRAATLLAVGLTVAACSGDQPGRPVSRVVTATVTTDVDGTTADLSFEVPPGTRSIGIDAVGEATSAIAVTELVLADGGDRVATPLTVQQLTEIAGRHVRLLPGGVMQEVGLGLHAFVHPNRPLDRPEVVPGPAIVRFVTTSPSLDVTVTMPAVADELVLPVDVYVTDPTIDSARVTAGLDIAADVLARAGLVVRWERSTADDLIGPGVSPDEIVEIDGPLSRLVESVRSDSTGALDLFIVADLPVSGLTPRIPGPAVESPLGAVVVEATIRPSDLGRVVAHELAHYLGLHHLEIETDDGETIVDQFPETEVGDGNLMDDGIELTDGQVDVIRRSPVLGSGSGEESQGRPGVRDGS